MAQDYNPTEIVATKGQIVNLKAIVFEWLYVEDENYAIGWLPSNKVISQSDI